MYLLDTNTLIYFFKDLGQVANRLLSHPPDQIAIPAVVVYEIAGTALAHQAILVTHNTREFSRAPGLQCEDWY